MCFDSLPATTLSSNFDTKGRLLTGRYSSSECSHPSQTSLAVVERELSSYCCPHIPRGVRRWSDGWAKELPAQRTSSAARLGKGPTHRTCMGMTSAAYMDLLLVCRAEVRETALNKSCVIRRWLWVYSFPQRGANCLNPGDEELTEVCGKLRGSYSYSWVQVPSPIVWRSLRRVPCFTDSLASFTELWYVGLQCRHNV